MFQQNKTLLISDSNNRFLLKFYPIVSVGRKLTILEDNLINDNDMKNKDNLKKEDFPKTRLNDIVWHRSKATLGQLLPWGHFSH